MYPYPVRSITHLSLWHRSFSHCRGFYTNLFYMLSSRLNKLIHFTIHVLTFRSVARVQKIIQADPDRLITSKNAAFAIALATEMFIQHLATTTHNVVKAERKPRRNIQYRDVSSAVAKTDNLEFLVDVVPKTTTYKEFKKRLEEKEKGKGKEKDNEEQERTNGPAIATEQPSEVDREREETAAGPTQDTPGHAGNGNIATSTAPEKPHDVPEAMEVDDTSKPDRVEDSEPEVDAAAMQIEMEMRGPPKSTPNASPEVRRTSGFTAINTSN